jgi:hypothetical protein
MISRPLSADTRSRRPDKPLPGAGAAPPAPSSSTVSSSASALSVAVTLAPEAFAYFATFVSASAATK